MILKASGIHKRYGDLHVLKGVEMDASAKEIVSIMGKSGTGKSTLLHILGTLDKADAGSVEICGTDCFSLSARELARFRNEKIGFIFQFHHLLNEFSALENVFIPALIQGASKRSAADRAKELLSYMGLEQRLTHKPTELSGGEQQRVAVARALMNKPEIVFADEPTGNLDTENSVELHNLFLKLRDDFGQSFVIVTHNPELAKLSDRVLHMQDGKFVSPAEA